MRERDLNDTKDSLLSRLLVLQELIGNNNSYYCRTKWDDFMKHIVSAPTY